MKKTIRVILSANAKEQYQQLTKIVEQEQKKGISSSVHQAILRSITQKSDWLKQNPFAGDQVEKNKIPKDYIKEYDITNLWRIELTDYWRMIYTVKSDTVEIITFILDIVDHNEYNNIFKYKKK